MEFYMTSAFSKILLFLSILIPLTLQGFEENKNDEKSQEKIYLNPENILIGQKCFYAVFDYCMFPLIEIKTDNEGIFIMRNHYQPNGTWQCPNCGYTNTWFDSSCSNCSWPEES